MITPKGNQILMEEQIIGPSMGFSNSQFQNDYSLTITNSSPHSTYIVKVYKIQGTSNLEKTRQALAKAGRSDSYKKIIVLARNFQQFSDYVRGSTHPKDKLVYGCSASAMMGVEAEQIMELPGFNEVTGSNLLKRIANNRLRKSANA